MPLPGVPLSSPPPARDMSLGLLRPLRGSGFAFGQPDAFGAGEPFEAADSCANQLPNFLMDVKYCPITFFCTFALASSASKWYNVGYRSGGAVLMSRLMHNILCTLSRRYRMSHCRHVDELPPRMSRRLYKESMADVDPRSWGSVEDFMRDLECECDAEEHPEVSASAERDSQSGLFGKTAAVFA